MTKFVGNSGLVTFTEEILNGKLHFLCSPGSRQKTISWSWIKYPQKIFGEGQNTLAEAKVQTINFLIKLQAPSVTIYESGIKHWKKEPMVDIGRNNKVVK